MGTLVCALIGRRVGGAAVTLMLVRRAALLFRCGFMARVFLVLVRYAALLFRRGFVARVIVMRLWRVLFRRRCLFAIVAMIVVLPAVILRAFGVFQFLENILRLRSIRNEQAEHNRTCGRIQAAQQTMRGHQEPLAE